MREHRGRLLLLRRADPLPHPRQRARGDAGTVQGTADQERELQVRAAPCVRCGASRLSATPGRCCCQDMAMLPPSRQRSVVELDLELLEVLTAFHKDSCYLCCSGGVAVKPRLLKRQVTGSGQVGFCTRSVLHHSLQLQQKLLSCPVGPSQGSGLVRSSVRWWSVML